MTSTSLPRHVTRLRGPGSRRELQGREALLIFRCNFGRAFPDTRHEITSFVASGTSIVGEGSFEWTSAGPS
jgi:predicted ester cyclase